MKTKNIFISVLILIIILVQQSTIMIKADSIPSAVASEYRNRIVTSARSYLGVEYVFGSMSQDAVDCSGLALLVYRESGFLNWNRYSHNTTLIRNGLIEDGCNESSTPQHIGCVFYSNNYGHMGIYVGGNQVIHASSVHDVVEYDNLDSRPRVYYKPANWMY